MLTATLRLPTVTRLLVALVGAVLVLAVPNAFGASGADTFRMPSGNIFCAYEHYNFAPTSLRCEIRSRIKPRPPRPASCGDAVWGEGYSMLRRGPAHVLCITDTIYDPKAKVLRYGTTYRYGVFRCTAKTTGLRCVNATGNGFFLSRRHSYTFRQTAPRYGAFKTPSGNIVCGWSIAPGRSGSIECGVGSGLKPPPAPLHCSAGDPNDKRVSLTATGRAVPVRCAGDPGPFLSRAGAGVLGYGQTWSGGGISCSSATTGLTCKNRVGHGFFLSRESWRTF
jgi:Family of unknown function (DUF6636)